MAIEHPHGPENAEHELKVAFKAVIEASVTHFWDRKGIAGVNSYDVISMYRRAYDAFRNGDRLASERWARSAKHLARAFWHEAMIAYFDPRTAELPCLEGAIAEYKPHGTESAARDLLSSLAGHVPKSPPEANEQITRYLSRAKRHLDDLPEEERLHELVRSERISAAHEYGRVVECLMLAYEAEARGHAAA